MVEGLFRIKVLRVCITDSCNLRCIYCFREGLKRRYANFLDFNKAYHLIKQIHEKYRLEKIKITGGEPLLSSNLETFVEKLKKLDTKICLNSNGTLLHKNKSILKLFDEFVLKMDTLNYTLFSRINRGSIAQFKAMIKNIKLARKFSDNVWVNCVLLSMNKQEADKIIDFALREKINVKFIELYKLRYLYEKSYYCPVEELREILTKRGAKFIDLINDGTREIYRIGPTQIHLITPYCNIPACYCCQWHYSSYILTPDLRIKPCIVDDTDFSLDALNFDQIEKYAKNINLIFKEKRLLEKIF